MQETGWGQSEAESEMWDKPYSLSIQDNSFLIEEAFNQEGGASFSTFQTLGMFFYLSFEHGF